MVSFDQPIWILALCSFLTASAYNNGESKLNSVYRLPDTLIPTFYNVSLTIDPNESIFTGSVRIVFELTNKNDTAVNIYIHTDLDFITIHSIVLNTIISCSIVDSNKADILEINCGNVTIQSEDFLDIEYEAKFSDDGYGMVKTNYTDEGEYKTLIQSYFTPNYARRVFPCMDEPAMKANFSIKVMCPDKYTVLSNSPTVDKTTHDTKGTRPTQFQVTPRISTYLVSIFISQLQTTVESSKVLDFKLFTRASAVNFTRVFDTYHSKILDAFSNYTGIPYENISDTECYHVADPDYYEDARGDFGIFTYRETEILDEGANTANRVIQDILTTVTYKLCHEWYGGDITTKWWSDVWSNEAVTKYLQYVITDKVNNEFDLYNQFVVEVVRKAMQYDAMPFAQPLAPRENDVLAEEEIQNKLDTTSYIKGASLLHMITYLLKGEYNFQALLRNHWNQRKGSDTDSCDLLYDLSSGDFVYYLIEDWVFLAGYPLVTIRISGASNETEDVMLSQKRFVYPTENSAIDENEWNVPLSSCKSTDKNFDVNFDGYLAPNSDVWYFPEAGSWIMFNIQGRFFYRVNYDEILWRRFITSLNDEDQMKSIHVLNRAQMVDDIFNIARIGNVSYSLAFDLASYLVNETEYYPWYSAFEAFSYLLGKMEDDIIEQNLRTYILNILNSVIKYPSTTFNGTHIEVLNYVQMLKWACYLGDSTCVNDSLHKFALFKDTPTGLKDYNVREVMLCTALRYSSDVLEDWEFLWNLYTTSSSVQEQIDILDALGCAKNKNLLEWYLRKIVTPDSEIKRQDALVVFKSVFSSDSVGLEAAMEFLETEFTKIPSLYKGIDILSEMIYAVAEKLITDEHFEWLRNLIANGLLDDYEDVRSKAITLTSVNNYWAKHYRSQITDIFQGPSTATETSATTKSEIITTATVPETTSSSTSSKPTVSTTTIKTTTESKSETIFLSKFEIIIICTSVLFVIKICEV